MAKIENINGTFTANQLVDLRTANKANHEVVAMCNQGIADLGDDHSFDAVEIANGQIACLVKL